MDSLMTFLSNSVLWKAVVAYWLFNAAVTALPQPNGGKVYQFVYRFLHTLAGNLDRAAQKLNVPGANG